MVSFSIARPKQDRQNHFRKIYYNYCSPPSGKDIVRRFDFFVHTSFRFHALCRFCVDLFRWVPCSQCFVFLWLSKLFAMSRPEEGYYLNVSWEHTLVYLLLGITCFLLVLHKRRYIILPVSLVIGVICTMIVFVFIYYIWLTISWYLYSQTY